MRENIFKSTTYKGSIFSNNIINFVNEIIENGIDKKASDIHIRDIKGKLFIEYRILGKLENYYFNEIINPLEVISRIKIMSKLDIAQKRLPQDGAIRYKEYDIRVAILPSVVGESVVLRILNSSLENISLGYLGFLEKDIELIKKAISQNHGLILITGPTGSGKSTTLLSLINLIDKKNRKVISIEDPVENKIDDIVQIQVKEEIGLSFENILRTSLRSDPDIIIISEIRDEITAKIAIRASLTGHLVISTLHTNDCISTFSRLIDMKIPKYLLIDSLICIISQRLIRLDEYFKSEKRRVCINELIYLEDDIKKIFEKNDDKLKIVSEIKKYGYISIEEKLRRLENERDSGI